MSDLEKRQRKMLAQATKEQKTRQGERRRQPRPKLDTEPIEKLFCERCRASLNDSEPCPRCVGGQQGAPSFCRRCLEVHASSPRCKPWSPATGEDRGRPATWRA